MEGAFDYHTATSLWKWQVENENIPKKYTYMLCTSPPNMNMITILVIYIPVEWKR